MFSTDVSQAYRQLPLDPGDWPLVCFIFEGSFYMDLSLPFGLSHLPLSRHDKPYHQGPYQTGFVHFKLH